MVAVSSSQWSSDKVIIDEEAIKILGRATGPTRDYNFLRVSCGVVKAISIRYFRQNIQLHDGEVGIDEEAIKSLF